MESKTFGDRLRALMSIRGFDKTELARQAKLHRNTVSRALLGIPSTTLETLTRLANVLNVDVEILFKQGSADLEQFAMTGHAQIDRLLHQFCYIRSIPDTPERKDLIAQLHEPLNKEAEDLNFTGVCASPHYNNESVSAIAFKQNIEIIQVRNQKRDGYNLRGISLGDEILMNDRVAGSNKSLTYRPICAYICGRFSVSMIAEGTVITESTSTSPWSKERDHNPMQEVQNHYTNELIHFTTRISNIRPDRQLRVGFKHWMAMPELREKHQQIDLGSNLPEPEEETHGSDLS